MTGDVIKLRPAPPLTLGAGLLVWGWQNGWLVYALPMAILLETARWATWRWPVSDREFNYISDLSSIVLAVVVVYLFTTEGAKGIFTILAIMPFVFFMLVLVQVYSSTGSVRLSALFLSLRRLDPETSPQAGARLDLTLPYFLTSLISASAGNIRTPWFFACVTVLIVFVLWTMRPRRYRAVIWAGMLSAVIGVAWAGQYGMRYTQYLVERHVMQIFDQYLWRYRDPNRTTTAIGSIGRIKASDRIMLRVRTGEPLAQPLLLREATYDNYRYGIWSNQLTEFKAVDPDVTGAVWNMSDGPATETAAVSTYFVDVSGIIPLPHGTARIRSEGATEIARNAYGATRMEIREGWIRYAVDYADRAAEDAPPADRDLGISSTYEELFNDLAERLGLTAMPPSGAVAAVRRFFTDGFTYTLESRQRYPRGRYLAEFLLNTRSGHCEFYATSTVLLLRAAGVPARYAVGYAVDEYSPIEGQYVARARHSHSWALAYVNGAWRVVDTTPAVWAPLEQEQSSALEPLFDLWSWASYRLSRWRTEDVLEESESSNEWMLWLLIPLGALLIWRLTVMRRVRRGGSGEEFTGRAENPGRDSALYALVTDLEQRGHARRPGETLAAWLRRLAGRLGLPTVEPALGLHYRYRFDPGGLSAAERDQLAGHVQRLREAL